MVACCPPGALPSLAIEEYTPKGADVALPNTNSLNAYIIGEEGKPAVHSHRTQPQRALAHTRARARAHSDAHACALARQVVVNYDVSGFGKPPPELGGGRVREVCDLLAATGLYVVMPDYFKGKNVVKAGKAGSTEEIVEWITTEAPHPLTAEAMVRAAVYFCKNRGAPKVGSIGFCWGAWLCARTSGKNDDFGFGCQVLLHASINAEGCFGGSEEALCKAVKVPDP